MIIIASSLLFFLFSDIAHLLHLVSKSAVYLYVFLTPFKHDKHYLSCIYVVPNLLVGWLCCFCLSCLHGLNKSGQIKLSWQRYTTDVFQICIFLKTISNLFFTMREQSLEWHCGSVVTTVELAIGESACTNGCWCSYVASSTLWPLSSAEDGWKITRDSSREKQSSPEKKWNQTWLDISQLLPSVAHLHTNNNNSGIGPQKLTIISIVEKPRDQCFHWLGNNVNTSFTSLWVQPVRTRTRLDYFYTLADLFFGSLERTIPLSPYLPSVRYKSKGQLAEGRNRGAHGNDNCNL